MSTVVQTLQKVAFEKEAAFVTGVELFLKEGGIGEMYDQILEHITANPERYIGTGIGALEGGLLGGQGGRGLMGTLGGALLGGGVGYGGGELAKAILSRMGSTGEGDKRPRDDKISYPDASKMDVTIPTEE